MDLAEIADRLCELAEKHGDPELLSLAKKLRKKIYKPRSPEANSYNAMKARCYTPSYHSRHRYTERGITVCDRWLYGEGGLSGFECFLADMGPKPSRSHTLDRKDNDLGYNRANCRWITNDEQQINKENTLKEDGVPLLVVARDAGLNYETVVNRYKRGDRGERLRRPIDRPSTNPRAGLAKRRKGAHRRGASS